MAKLHQVSGRVNVMQQILIAGCYRPANDLELKSDSGKTLCQGVMNVARKSFSFTQGRFCLPTFELNIHEEKKEGGQEDSKNHAKIKKPRLAPPSCRRNERNVVQRPKQQDRMDRRVTIIEIPDPSLHREHVNAAQSQIASGPQPSWYRNVRGQLSGG